MTTKFNEIQTKIITEVLWRIYDRTINPKKDYWDATVEHEYAMTCGCEGRTNHSIMHHIWERGYVYDMKVNSAKTKVTILVAPLVDESLIATIKDRVKASVPSITTCDVKVASSPEYDEDAMMRHRRMWKDGIGSDEDLSMQGGL